ncbi:Photosystem II D1 precursor processing protein-H2 [Arachis hypogaea]|nr:Photosystem II D1 precursor processing protein-H2 [Arachis hypogaea]
MMRRRSAAMRRAAFFLGRNAHCRGTVGRWAAFSLASGEVEMRRCGVEERQRCNVEERRNGVSILGEVVMAAYRSFLTGDGGRHFRGDQMSYPNINVKMPTRVSSQSHSPASQLLAAFPELLVAGDRSNSWGRHCFVAFRGVARRLLVSGPRRRRGPSWGRGLLRRLPSLVVFWFWVLAVAEWPWTVGGWQLSLQQTCSITSFKPAHGIKTFDFVDKVQSRSNIALPPPEPSSSRRQLIVDVGTSLVTTACQCGLSPSMVWAEEKSSDKEDDDNKGIVGAITSLFDPNEKTKKGKVLPKAYLKSAREVVKTLRESLNEPPDDIAKFRRTADTAKESIREYLGSWRGKQIVVQELYTFFQLSRIIRYAGEGN